MNITKKIYNKIYLSAVIHLMFLEDNVYFGVVTSHKILFSYISTSSLSYIRFFSKIKLVKTELCTQLRQTNLENQLHISTDGKFQRF